MRVPATERTAEVLPASVAGMGQEEDPAVPATDTTPPEIGPAPQRRPQHEVVRQDQVADLALAIPARSKRESLLDGYKRKPRVSDRMLRLIMLLALPDSPRVVQGRARAFSPWPREASLSSRCRWPRDHTPRRSPPARPHRDATSLPGRGAPRQPARLPAPQVGQLS